MINRFDTDDKKVTGTPVRGQSVIDKTPISPTEKIVREEIRRLAENDEEIQTIKDQLERKKKAVE